MAPVACLEAASSDWTGIRPLQDIFQMDKVAPVKLVEVMHWYGHAEAKDLLGPRAHFPRLVDVGEDCSEHERA